MRGPSRHVIWLVLLATAAALLGVGVLFGSLSFEHGLPLELPLPACGVLSAAPGAIRERTWLEQPAPEAAPRRSRTDWLPCGSSAP